MISIRPASQRDLPLICAYVRELAEYEQLAHEAVAIPDDLRAALFGDEPRIFCDLAESDGAPVGFALWFYTFSSFTGRPGIYLEDLYVRSEHRGQGAGRALLTSLARRCAAEGLGRLEWAVLDWNAPSIAFYQSLGAAPLSDGTLYRLTGEPLEAVGREATPSPSIAVRRAASGDSGLIHGFLGEFAESQKMANDLTASERDLRAGLFGGRPRAFCEVAEWAGEPAGFADWIYSFSTFKGRHGIFLEDLYVRAHHRGRGLGRALLRDLARRCVTEGLARLEWGVMDWNAPAIAFYESLGAKPMSDWTVYRLTGDALAALGEREDA